MAFSSGLHQAAAALPRKIQKLEEAVVNRIAAGEACGLCFAAWLSVWKPAVVLYEFALFLPPGDPETSKCNQRNAWKQAKWNPMTDLLCIIMFCSLASYTLCRERKGLVTLQPSSWCHSRNLLWPMKSALFCRLHPLSWSNNYVTYLADVSILLFNGTVW